MARAKSEKMSNGDATALMERATTPVVEAAKDAVKPKGMKEKEERLRDLKAAHYDILAFIESIQLQGKQIVEKKLKEAQPIQEEMALLHKQIEEMNKPSTPKE